MFLAFLCKVSRLEADNKDQKSKIQRLKADVEMYQEVVPELEQNLNFALVVGNQKLPKRR